MAQTAHGAVPRSAVGGVVLLRPDRDYGHAAGDLLRGGHDQLSVRQGIRIFDYAQFAEPLRERIRQRGAGSWPRHTG